MFSFPGILQDVFWKVKTDNIDWSLVETGQKGLCAHSEGGGFEFILFLVVLGLNLSQASALTLNCIQLSHYFFFLVRRRGGSLNCPGWLCNLQSLCSQAGYEFVTSASPLESWDYRSMPTGTTRIAFKPRVHIGSVLSVVKHFLNYFVSTLVSSLRFCHKYRGAEKQILVMSVSSFISS